MLRHKISDSCSPIQILREEGFEGLLQTWTPLTQWLETWFCNPKYTPMAQVIVAIVWGIILSPWSQGLIFLVASVIAYEVAFYLFTRNHPQCYNNFTRTGVICASILGYIVGRTLSVDEILISGME